MKKLLITLVIGLAAVSWGCHNGGLEDNMVEGLMQGAHLSLDAEEVTLTGPQLSCGVENGLWFAPEEMAGRSVARITDQARSLGFSDDVSMEPGFLNPHVQVRGQIPIVVGDTTNIRDGANGTKVAEVHVSIVLNHDCFRGTLLPIMGVRKGQFAEGSLPLVAFYQENDGWHYDKFVH